MCVKLVIHKDCNKVYSQQNIKKKDMILVEKKLHETDAELEAYSEGRVCGLNKSINGGLWTKNRMPFYSK